MLHLLHFALKSVFLQCVNLHSQVQQVVCCEIALLELQASVGRFSQKIDETQVWGSAVHQCSPHACLAYCCSVGTSESGVEAVAASLPTADCLDIVGRHSRLASSVLAHHGRLNHHQKHQHRAHESAAANCSAASDFCRETVARCTHLFVICKHYRKPHRKRKLEGAGGTDRFASTTKVLAKHVPRYCKRQEGMAPCRHPCWPTITLWRRSAF